MTLTQINLADIEDDTDLQAMPNDPVLVEEYADAMVDGDEFPPIVVFRDVEAKNWVGDGRKRLKAMRRLEWGTTNADVRPGTQRDAFLFSVGANLKHGCRATLEDRVHCAKLLLQDEEWRKWADTVIAGKCGLGATKVAAIRKETGAGSFTRLSSRNGKMLETDTTNIGRTEQPESKRIKRMVKAIELAIRVGERVSDILPQLEALREVLTVLQGRMSDG
jgi:hypothetical protein